MRSNDLFCVMPALVVGIVSLASLPDCSKQDVAG
jgi:hypothetical protein